MSRYGFFGTQSVGKTTLLNALRSEPDLAKFKFADQLTRQVAAEGFKINENGDDNTQMQIARKHAENVILYDNLITDRTIVDCYAYTIYLRRRGKVSLLTADKINKYMQFLLPMFTCLFYIPIEFDNENDGIRSTDPTFRKEIDDIMTGPYIFDGINVKVPVYKISGSVVQRTNTVYEIIKGF